MKLVAVTVHFRDSEQTSSILRRLLSDECIDRIVAVLHGPYTARVTDPKVDFLESKNRGYGAGLNLAVRYIQEKIPEADLILALNPDVEPVDSQIRELIEEHFQSGADCTFPALLEGRTIIGGYCFGRFGTLRHVAGDATFYPATCFLITPAAWNRAGGFNEEYFHYFEDADFCLRLQHAGCRVHHASSITIRHIGKSGVDYPETQLPRYAVRNHLLFLFRIRKMNVLTFLNVAIRQFLYLFRWKCPWRGFRPWLAGVREFLSMRTQPPQTNGASS